MSSDKSRYGYRLSWENVSPTDPCSRPFDVEVVERPELLMSNKTSRQHFTNVHKTSQKSAALALWVVEAKFREQ